MVQPVTAHSSFVYLVDNIPTWQASLGELSAHASQKNSEFVAEYTRLVNCIRPKHKKSPSVASIRTEDDHPADEPADAPTLTDKPTSGTDIPSPPDRAEIDPFEAGNKYLYAQARRKRKPGNTLPSGASGPQKFRNKNQVVVYYDAYLQERLDVMVKQIGVGRNNLRKGKNALVAAKGFQLPRLNRPAAREHPSIEDIRSTMLSRTTSAFLSVRTSGNSPEQTTPDHETSFLLADKELEAIQSLCETAAHQFLRDGDCKTEMDSILQKFEGVLTQATTTADSLKQLEQEQLSKAGKVEGDYQASVGSDRGQNSDSDVTLSIKPSLDVLHPPKLTAHSPLAINHTLDDMKSRNAFFSTPAISHPETPAGLGPDNIEVDDDSDQSSIIVDITSYRLANPRRMKV